ncbi:lysine--tRNA ligase [Kitasatospora sp. NPDC088779]|uniref:lysine--tRNA ligase n=1 Tax=unclassified Kitasatospora TaxID=2633591 RepID=UPI00343B4CDC
MGVKQGDWVAAAADQVIAEGKRRDGAALVCASGISPSGPVHLGNLREIMVPHFVADELRRRGLECRHVLSWDDYDRLRKVPAGVPSNFAEHIGRPLTAVPDPCGEHENWAEHFKAPLRAALAKLGVEVDEISQTQMYTSGAYREQIVHAMRHRQQIDGVLGRYRTKKAAVDAEVEQDDEDLAAASAAGYYPYRPYCEVCGRDSTTVVSFNDASTQMQYRCECGHEGGFALSETDGGKLVWKVDWPMRWAFEGVTFEAGGVDHSSPGSSFTVGSQVVREIFDGLPPSYLGYSFVGISGMAKMSSSKGGVPTPIDILEVVEPAVLRWLYNRRQPRQSFSIALDAEILRLYDEWDALGRKVEGATATELEVAVRARSLGPAAGPLPSTPRPLPFRTLASVADVAAGDPKQTLRILQDFTVGEPLAGLDEAQPRLDRAQAWVSTYVPAEERTQVRAEPDRERLEQLSPVKREALKLLLDGLDENWSLDGLTALVYGVPKIQAGLPLDAPASPELKVAQRELFVLLYELLVGRDTGPRLPTLLLALGADRIRSLLTVA